MNDKEKKHEVHKKHRIMPLPKVGIYSTEVPSRPIE
jgi:hypothetical protein